MHPTRNRGHISSYVSPNLLILTTLYFVRPGHRRQRPNVGPTNKGPPARPPARPPAPFRASVLSSFHPSVLPSVRLTHGPVCDGRVGSEAVLASAVLCVVGRLGCAGAGCLRVRWRR